jgi:hypothetical protein
MTRVTKVTVERSCAICERTLLMGERAIRFSPNGGGDYVDVCPLCSDAAVENGWLREGAPTTPMLDSVGRGRRRGWLSTLLGTKPQTVEEEVAEPILRRLSERELLMVEAADVFNASQYRRTIGGIGRSLGAPRVSVVVLSGVNAEVVVTVAWEISWYQYRVAAEHGGHVRLEDRGDDPGGIDQRWRDWNAQVADDGRLTLV